ncbi:MAG: hypothetical protein HYV20_08180 [Gemmatimonadetes bacterium]|nr:hypothetical protein [Gemmatimonadota bacterium]
MRMKDCLLLLASLVSLAPPVFALAADRILGFSARGVLLVSVPLLLVLLAIFVYALRTRHRIHGLILWGLVGGLLGTVALDAVRLVGVRLGAFPMDMPRMFGLIGGGLAPEFQTNTMATLVKATADLPEEQRREVMRRRLHFLASVDETSRRAFIGAMMKGLLDLPPEKRMEMISTQMSLLGELDPEASGWVSASMSTVMGGGPALPVFPSGIELYLRVPRVPMNEFRTAAEFSYPRTLDEAMWSDGRVAALGYLWHFMIGATLGIAYTLLFGRGRWLWAFGWGAFVWLAMMLLMPVMMPMIHFPWWFPAVPFVAHMAMAVAIGGVALRFVKPEADAKSFVGLWRLDRQSAAAPG